MHRKTGVISFGESTVLRPLLFVLFVLWSTGALRAQEEDNAVVLDAEQAMTYYARAEAMTHGLTNSFRAFYSLDRLVRDFQFWQNLGVAIAPPSTNAFFIHRNDFHVFDPTGFPAQVLSGLIPETYRGGMATVYRVFVGEDPYTRYRVIFNASGQLLWAQPPPDGYNPWRHLPANRFWALESDSAEAETARAIYDPSRVWCEYLLLPIDSVPSYASAWAYVITTNQIATLSATASSMSMASMSAMNAPASNDFVFTDFTFTNGIADMEIHLPGTNGFRVDIFYTAPLTNFPWSLATTTPTNFGYFRIQFACSASNLFFRAGNADVDNDGDGLPDDRETLMYGTDPTKWDTDGDGLSDGYEIANGLNPLKRDTDGDGTDDDEFVLAGGGVASTASIRYYYDGDDRLIGTYAGSGSGGGANTIANTAAGNTATAAERSTP